MSWEQLNPPGRTAFERERWIDAHNCHCVCFLKQLPKEIRWNLEGHWYPIGQKLPCLHFQGTKVQLRIS